MSVEFYWIAVAVVTVLSASRITRLFVADKFPPTMWIRNTYGNWTDKGPRRLQWQLLLFCGFCFGFWATAFVVAWGYLSGVYGHEERLDPQVWWLANGVLGGSYLAAMVMARDGDDSGDEDSDGDSDGDDD